MQFGVTKGVIMGLAWRNGFPAKPRKKIPQRERKSRDASYEVAALPPLVDHPDHGAPTGRCRWIHDRISYGVFRCCEHPTYNLSSWCLEHENVVFIRTGKQKAAALKSMDYHANRVVGRASP